MKLKSKKERNEQILAPQKLANGRVLSLDAPQGLTPLKFAQQGLNPTRAFSVAEAMIALLIGTIVLGFSAPMITKQLKHNDYSDAQAQIVNRRIEKLIESNNALKQEIETLKKSSGGVPKGTVAFFNNTVVAESATNPCPKGWSLIDSNWQGRFPRFAGKHLILEYDTAGKTYKDTGVEETLSVGQIQEDAIRNVLDNFNLSFRDDSSSYPTATSTSGVFSVETTWSKWGFGGGGGRARNYKLTMNLSKGVPVDVENRPKAVALLGCVKN